jgi:Kef-type K+ transport system membrane component KefB
MDPLIADIGIILIVATVLAIISRFFRQPIILGYMLAGIIIGPVGLGWVMNQEVITTLSEIGIAFLLFIVGLELDIRKLKHLGAVSLIVGLGQIVLTFIAGYLLGTLLGIPSIYAFYISIALTLSSTVIIVKLFSDRNEINALHARISLGVLLVQDFVAVIILAMMANSGSLDVSHVISNLIVAIGFFAVSILLGTFFMRTLFRPLAKSSELLFLSAVSWCFAYAMVSQWLGFSIAIGAFLAGISLAPLPYHIEIASRIKSLRDFFATIFFVTLGMQIVLNGLQNIIWPIILLSLFVLICNPLIVLVLMCAMGFKARPAFLTGLSLAQISEFSLIMMATGYSLGIIPQTLVSVTAIIAVITFTVSSYMITYDERLYRIFKKLIKPFESLSIKGFDLEYCPEKEADHKIILCGCDRIGHAILESSQKLKKSILVIDFNPELIKRLMKEQVHCVYGDISDIEIMDKLNFKKAEMVISTIPDYDDSLMLVKKVKADNKKAVVIVTAEDVDDALALYKQGADYVILPHMLGGEHISILLQESAKDIGRIMKNKKLNIAKLKKRWAHKNGHN